MKNDKKLNEKQTDVLKNIKKLYKDAQNEEKNRLGEIIKELSTDQYYKENMTHYFQQFLSEKY